MRLCTLTQKALDILVFSVWLVSDIGLENTKTFGNWQLRDSVSNSTGNVRVRPPHLLNTGPCAARVSMENGLNLRMGPGVRPGIEHRSWASDRYLTFSSTKIWEPKPCYQKLTFCSGTDIVSCISNNPVNCWIHSFVENSTVELKNTRPLQSNFHGTDSLTFMLKSWILWDIMNHMASSA
jgi:hypothetical protein